MSAIKSYEEKLSDVEKMLDAKKKEAAAAFPRTESYTKTVGFGEQPNELKPGSYTSPVSIPVQPRKTSTAPIPSNSPLDKGYKSQLQGWSTDGKEASILSSSPRSFETKNSVTSPKSAPVTTTTAAKATTTTTTTSSSHVGKQPELKLDPKQAKNMTKEERRAQYEAMAAQKNKGKTETAPPKKQPQQQQQQDKTLSKEERKAQYEALAQKKQEQRKDVVSTTPPSSSTAAPPPRKLSSEPASTAVTTTVSKEEKQPKRTMQFDDVKKRKAAEKKKIVHLQPSSKQVNLFSHLPQYERNTSLKFNIGFTSKDIHPEFLSLGLKYAQGTIMGSTARCVALLTAFRKVIAEFESPNGDLFRDFDLKPLVQFIVDCRPMSVSMGNAINYIKLCLSNTKTMNETEAKAYMDESIDRFINERILVAGELIAKHGNSKIHDGDVILTYARSHVVEMTLIQAHKEGKKFRVVVVDSHPKKEGKELLARLSKLGIKCTYVLISAVSYIMSSVTKVFVGAYTMMANGNLMSRVGTALIAIMAQSYHVPFIVCCETCKFSERVQLESISFNELGDPDELVMVDSEEHSAVLKDWKDIPNLKLLNLMYDLTPSEFIVMVVTEVGLVPPSSVPVILREYRKEPQEY